MASFSQTQQKGLGRQNNSSSPHIQNWLVDPRVVVSNLEQQAMLRASAGSIKPWKHQTLLLCPDSLPYEMQQLTWAGREMRDAAARIRRDRGRDVHRAGTAPNPHRGARRFPCVAPSTAEHPHHGEHPERAWGQEMGMRGMEGWRGAWEQHGRCRDAQGKQRV